MKNSALFADDMIAVEIDTAEMKNGATVGQRLRGTGGGIPWSVILDADGNELINSDGPDGNIGYPTKDSEIDYFLQMLRVARPEMKPENINSLKHALQEYAESRNS